MPKHGLLVDYRWCTGCHSCELACQMEQSLPPDQYGIKIAQIGPWCYGEDSWQYSYFPLLTDQCDLCEKRVAEGKRPACVHHCQAQCIEVISAEEAGARLCNDKRYLFITT